MNIGLIWDLFIRFVSILGDEGVYQCIDELLVYESYRKVHVS